MKYSNLPTLGKASKIILGCDHYGETISEEIAYKQEAYIKIQDTSDLYAFIDECASFCCAAGASEVFVSGCLPDDVYPLHARIIGMVCDWNNEWTSDCSLVPVTEESVVLWSSIYNRKMKKSIDKCGFC